MHRLATIPLVALLFTACVAGPPATPPPPDTVVRLDTITITREVTPPLPRGTLTTLCLADGQTAEIRVSSTGDTLLGPRRVRLDELGHGIGFVGEYAAGEDWFVDDDAIPFDGRRFSRFGPASSLDCDDVKVVGDHDGVNLFAETAASEPFQVIYVPVRPGVFQPYEAQVGRVRG